MQNWISDVKYYRYIFYAINVIFWILGWGSLAVGIWLYTEDSFTLLAPSSYSAMSAAGLCISSGVMVLIIAFIGCISIWIQSKRLLLAYFCFICLLFLVQCTTGIMGYFYKDAVRERVKYSLYTTINHTYAIEYGYEKNLRITWDYMQTSLKCCGVDNYTNWWYSPQWPKHRFVPDSCCDVGFFKIKLNNSMTNCGKSHKNERLFYKEGCNELFTDQLLQHMYILGIVSLLFAIVEIIILITSIRLLHYFQKQEKRFFNNNNKNNMISCRFNQNNGVTIQNNNQQYSSLIASNNNNTTTTIQQ